MEGGVVDRWSTIGTQYCTLSTLVLVVNPLLFSVGPSSNVEETSGRIELPGNSEEIGEDPGLVVVGTDNESDFEFGFDVEATRVSKSSSRNRKKPEPD